MTDCLQCGKEIEIVDANSKYKKFCNRVCSGTYNSSRRKVNPEWFDSIRKERICKICNSSISEEYLKIYKHTKFCSETCKENAPRKLRGREKAIKAESPYENMEYYILTSKSNGRKSVSLFHIGGEHYKHMSYARYLMSVHLGRILEKEEQIDHINNNPLDDRLENFQILSHAENMQKYRIEGSKGRLLVEIICPCGKQFIKEKRNTHLVGTKRSLNTYCSRKCSGHFGPFLKETKTVILREYKEFE